MFSHFTNGSFEFQLELTLGTSYRRGADVGEVLAAAATIKDGDPDSWHTVWLALAERTEAMAGISAASGRRVSARDAYLRAASYYAAATSFLDGSSDPSRLEPTWKSHRRCWDNAVDRFDPPVERLTIPFEKTTLPGYFFSSGEDHGPALILVNGSDGPDTLMWCMYGAEAIDRGYHAILVDGPGQQAALFDQQIAFIPDWERVVTPTVDWLVARPDVDPAQIAEVGASQGGYWAPRAAAFEPRLAACIADPGVFDCFAPWRSSLPPEAAAALDHDDKARFDALMWSALDASPQARQNWLFRARPYGADSPFDVFRAAEHYTLEGVADRITCPTLLCDPEGEQFWPGQAERLYQAITAPKRIEKFIASEGASLHCEPLAIATRSLRIFDWLDDQLGR